MRIEETYRSDRELTETQQHIRSAIVPNLERAHWEIVAEAPEVITLRRSPQRAYEISVEYRQRLTISLRPDRHQTTVQVIGAGDPLTKSAFDRSPWLLKTTSQPATAGSRPTVVKWLFPGTVGSAPLNSPPLVAAAMALGVSLWGLDLAGVSLAAQVVLSLVALLGLANLHRIQAERYPDRVAVNRLGSLRSYLSLLSAPTGMAIFLVGLLARFPQGIGIWIFFAGGVVSEVSDRILAVRLR
jgi:hypothetical protein